MMRADRIGKIAARGVMCAAVAIAFNFSQAAAGDGAPGCTHKTDKGSCCPADAKKLKPQTTCPVMGNEINKTMYTDVKGKRIYVCCKGCIPTINKNPDKYIKKLEKMGQCPEPVPASATGAAVDTKDMQGKCPMMSDTSKVKGCFTCSMHPEVMNKEAGKCPTCGMDLVFKTCPMDSGKTKGACCKMKH